jgi:FAD synthetase
MRVVLAFGSFDVLHPGHVHYLASAKRLGDRLIVIVARDESIRMMKHREPVFGERARVEIIGSLKMVDKAVLGNRLGKRSDIYNIFRKYRPDVIALGYDQKADVRKMRQWLEREGMKARIVRLRTKLNDDLYKSSKIIGNLDI